MPAPGNNWPTPAGTASNNWQVPGGAVITTKGDIAVGGPTGAIARLPVGLDGQALFADSTQALGLNFATSGLISASYVITPISLASQSAAQDVLPAGGRLFTAAALRLYRFRLELWLTGTTTSSYTLMQFNLGGGAVVGELNWIATFHGGGCFAASSAAAAQTGNAATYYERSIVLNGTFRLTTGGTISPQISNSVATPGVWTVRAGSRWEITDCGLGTGITGGQTMGSIS